MPIADQIRFSRYLREVGGYDEAFRLDREATALKKANPGRRVIARRDAQGRYQMVLVKEPTKEDVPVESFEPAGLTLKCGNDLVPFHEVTSVDISQVEQQRVIVRTAEREYEALGFDAIEIVMQLKPSAIEGRRLKWNKGAWAFHNFVAHPLMQVMVWMGYKKAAIRLHDRTTPRPR